MAGEWLKVRYFFPDAVLTRELVEWKRTPWYGDFDRTGCPVSMGSGVLYAGAPHASGWTPRRAYPEWFRRMTGADCGDDPDAWEGWIRTHPHLAWDGRLMRLVDAPTK